MGDDGGRRARVRAHRRGRRAYGGHAASNATPATGSIMRPRGAIAALPQIVELNIGHFLIGEAVFVGLAESIRQMRQAIDEGARRRTVMIIGFGSDLCDIRRIEQALERYGERFIAPLLHRDRARRSRTAAPRARPPTPSASPPRRPAPRRSAPASATASPGRHGRRQSALRQADRRADRRRGGAAGRDHAAGRDGRHSPHADRRISARAGPGSHRGADVIERASEPEGSRVRRAHATASLQARSH